MSHEPPQREPAPTVVVGVGKAGIDVINTLHESDGFGWGEAYDDYFDYVAIDSNANDVVSAPEKATPVLLDSSAKTAAWDKEHYPYLTPLMDIYERGTGRQRPVGRYKLDNVGSPTWDDHYNKINDAIRNHLNDMQRGLDTNTNQFNVIHVHSLGGGTGSGTFPLLAAMLDEMTRSLQAESSVTIYTAGIGVVPEITTDMDVLTPPGDPRYYANTHAALQDLNKLLTATVDDPLPVHLYSRHVESNEDLNSLTHTELEPHLEIARRPYRHYFLVGVDEAQIAGSNAMAGPETYRAAVDNTIGAAIYGLAMYGGAIENWEGDIQARDQFGSFGQTRLSVPIEEVRAYCELNEQVAELREQVAPTDDHRQGRLIEEREKKIAERDDLQAIVDDPVTILSEYEDSERIRNEVEERIKRNVPRGDTVLETTTDDIDTLVETVREQYDERIVAFAMDETAEYIQEQGEDVKTAWRELVNEKYRELEVKSEVDFGSADTTEGKATELRRFIEERIEEIEQRIAERQKKESEKFFPTIFDDPDYEAWLDTYRDHRAELDEQERRKEQLASLTNEVRNRRDEVLEETIVRLETLRDEVMDLRREIKDKQDRLREIRAEREAKIEELTDAEYGERLGYLALDEQKVREDLDAATLEEELTSLAAFDEKGYLQHDFADVADSRIKQAYAWESALLTWSDEDISPSAFADSAETIRDIWMLHSEENSDLPAFDLIGAGSHEFHRSGEDGAFPPFEDPYTVQFLTYTLDSPLSRLKIYTELENAAEDSTLDELVDEIDEWEDHRWAFAYPEWYPEEIQIDERFSVELPALPELDIKAVQRDADGREFHAWVCEYGIAEYLWHGEEWDDYLGDPTVKGDNKQDGVVGWKHTLGNDYGLELADVRAAIPSNRPAALWLGGVISWEELLEEVGETLLKDHGLDVTLV